MRQSNIDEDRLPCCCFRIQSTIEIFTNLPANIEGDSALPLLDNDDIFVSSLIISFDPNMRCCNAT